MNWISVKDKLPRYEGKYIIHRKNVKSCIRIADYKLSSSLEYCCFWDSSGIQDVYVTHWMPLPEVPE